MCEWFWADANAIQPLSTGKAQATYKLRLEIIAQNCVCVYNVGLIEIIAGIQIVLAADLKPNLFIPGSDPIQDFTIDFPWSIFHTF